MKKLMLILVFIFIAVFPSGALASNDENTLMQGDSGQEVILLQQRLKDLGYLNYRPTGKFSDMTVSALIKFQTENGIDPDGQAGRQTQRILFSDDAKKCPMNSEISKISGPAFSGAYDGRGELSSWENINVLFTVGSTATVTDYNTGSTYEVSRVGGVNSAHVSTVSENDYDTYLYTFGNGQSWEHRSCVVKIGTKNYAASIFGMPTGGSDANGSGMKGYTILYFNNSKTDLFSLPDEEHVIALNRIAS